MAKLDGKVALITGAAVGLGEGISTVYAKYGAKLVMVDLDPKVEQTAEKLRKEYGAEIVTVVANVADREQMDAAAKKGVDAFGEINVACCNAGVCRLAPFEEMDDKTRDFHIDVNIKGVWNTCKAVVPYMLKQGGGNIVIASSVTGDIVADAGEAAYAMTKAALVGLTKCLAVEYAARNIRVNCSQLGYARTPMVEKMAMESNPNDPESAINDIAVGVPMKRLAKPIEVGELFAFLGSDESSYLTGSQIVIDGVAQIDMEASYNHWKIFVIALMVITALGVLIEYYFTRERVTEESITKGETETKKAVPLLQQIKVCMKDKFWWIIILFFFLYQLGGMMKNTSQLYYCSALFADANGNYSTAIGGGFHGTLSIVGAIPTAVGMVLAWPLSNKIGKGKAILFGAVLSAIGGAIGFIAPDNFALACTAFVIKALGSTPAMYLSLALLADVLDHQEAMHGFRTDGFTMTIYGAIMAGMTGIATGILNITLSATGYSAEVITSDAIQTAMTWIFFGGETICYGLIAVIFIFMGVEKFSKFDHLAITQDQKAKAEADGVEYIDPAERLKMEEAEAEAASEEARKEELRKKCEKQGLNFEEEEQKYQDMMAKKREEAEAKKAQAEAKKAEKEAEKAAKLEAMSPEEKAALEEKQRRAAEKQAAAEAAALEEFNELRKRNNRPVLEVE